jgi:ATP-dependent RNA helicase RhlE
MENTPLTFDGLGIAPAILDVLTRLKLTTPTPIQAKCIPQALEGKDLIGIAQTGTGKTFAFGIPMIQELLKGNGGGLVVLPTRELAIQVEVALRTIGLPLGLRTAVLIGGENMERQRAAMRKNPHIIIATPGRLIDHMEHKTVSLKGVSMLVLDEADRMLDMGFAPQLKKILAAVPKERHTMLFSATMPQEIISIATAEMNLPLRVEVAPQGTAAELVTQELFFVVREQKLSLLEKLLQEYRGPVLVFTRTKFGAKKAASALKQMGHTAAELHSNKSLNQRKEALEGFKRGTYRVLVATDIAARGIDVVGIEAVINFDLPDNAEDYVHRIGRTGRAGHKGHAISFATPDQSRDVRDIERLMRTKLPVSKLPAELPAARAYVMPLRDARPPFGGGGRRPFRPHGAGSASRSSGPRKPYVKRYGR